MAVHQTRPRGAAPRRLTPLAEAEALLRAALPGAIAVETRRVRDALGLVLAAPLVAAAPVPDRARADCDGRAVAACDTVGAAPHAPAPLPAEPPAVAPGDPLPPGADAVLPHFAYDDVPIPQALAALAPGEGVCGIGDEIAAGTVLRAEGERLAARDLPALLALGIAEVAVRVPRLAWIAAGPGIADDPSRDTLHDMLAPLARQAGAMLVRAPAVPRRPDAVASALAQAARNHDLVLLVGGTGDGPDDHAAAGLAAAGRVLFEGLGARPGTTAGAGLVGVDLVGADLGGACPVLLLPGQVEDALAAWILLVAPVLDVLSGAAATPPLRLRLRRKVASSVGLSELVPLQRDPAGGVLPLAVGRLPAAALAAAGAMLVVPPGSEGYEAGTEITALPW